MPSQRTPMLVYGSPSRAWASRDLAAKLHGAARALRYRTDPPLTSELRALLIYAGQLEQGLSDALDDGTYPAPFAVTLSRYATAGAAAALYHGGMRARVALATSEFVLKRLQRHEDVRLRITVPEGYAYHGLYPEQYVGAAHAWARTHTPEPSGYALVVGLRTIGTSLAAMVAAVLRQSPRRCDPQVTPMRVPHLSMRVWCAARAPPSLWTRDPAGRGLPWPPPRRHW